MSYLVMLKRNGIAVKVPMHNNGAPMGVGGESVACLSVAYSHVPLINNALHITFSSLDGVMARASIDMLRRAVRTLGILRSDNNWESTPGNAGFALNAMLMWAQRNPDAIWSIR